jgi:hypothetical protein
MFLDMDLVSKSNEWIIFIPRKHHTSTFYMFEEMMLIY